MSKPLLAIAWSLAAQGSVAFVWGAWVVGLSIFTERTPLGRTGDVIGPPEEVVSFALTAAMLAFGVLVLSIGGLDLIAGLAFLRRKSRAWMIVACPVNAFVWLFAAGAAFLKAGGVHTDLRVWAGLGLLAVGLALAHLAALRACFRARGNSRIMSS